MNLRDLTAHLKEMKHYVIAALGTFLVGIYLGYAESEQFLFFLQGQAERLREVVEGVQRMNHTPWMMFLFIFFNNIMVSLMMVFTGSFFGFMPLFALISNGMLIGFLAEQAVPDIGWSTFILSVVPHGIIEIPAVILACAYGLKFGVLAAKTLVFLPSASRRSVYGKQFLRVLKLTIPLSLILFILLLAAALIESFLTPIIAS